MRLSVPAAFTVLLAIAFSAALSQAWLQPAMKAPKPERSRKLLTSLRALASERHGFKAQQAEYLEPASSDARCRDGTWMKSVLEAFTLCSASSMPTSNSSVRTTTTGVREAWEDFCGGACMKGVDSLYASELFQVCLHPALKLQIEIRRQLCRSRDGSGDRCGVTMSRLTFVSTCDEYRTQSTCSQASEFCTWNTRISGSGFSYFSCDSVVTQNSVSALCGSCMRGLAILNNKYSTWGDQSFSEELTDLCLKAPTGAYCAPLLMQFEQAGVELDDISDSQTSSEAICSKPDVLYCWRAAMAVEAARQVTAARSNFVSCAKWYENNTMSSYETTIYCLPSFVSSVLSARITNRASSILCTKNGAGKYCLPLGSELLSTSCARTAMGGGNCSAECTKNVSKSVDDLGCCVGLVDGVLSMRGSTSMYQPYVPSYTYYDVDWWRPRVNLGLSALENCSAQNLTLEKRCTLPMDEMAKSGILVRMVFSEVTKDFPTRARVIEALEMDIAQAARVPLDSVVSYDLYPSNEVMVNTSTTSRRQGTMSEGCRWEFNIRAPTPAEIAVALTNVRNAANLGRLPLKNTKAVLQQLCPTTCVGSDGVNSIELTQASSGSSVLGLVLLTLVSAVLVLF